MDTQPSQPEAPTPPDLSPEPAVPTPASSKKIIQPTADTPKATVNVGSFAPTEQAQSALATPPRAAATPPVSFPTPATPEPTVPTFGAPSQTPIDEWKSPSSSTSPFTTPNSVFIFSLMAPIAAFVFATFAVGFNVWAIIAILVVLSAIAAFLSIKAYAKDTGSIVLVSMIISVMMLLGSVFGGATYTYYYFKFKSFMNSFNSSSSSSSYDDYESSSSDDYEYDYDSSSDSSEYDNY